MIRDTQVELFGPTGGNVQLMPGVNRPILPPVDDVQNQPAPIDLRGLADPELEAETDAGLEVDPESEDVQMDVQQ